MSSRASRRCSDSTPAMEPTGSPASPHSLISAARRPAVRWFWAQTPTGYPFRTAVAGGNRCPCSAAHHGGVANLWVTYGTWVRRCDRGRFDELIGPMRAKFEAVTPHLNERQCRLLYAAEARQLGHGGIACCSRRRTGSAPTTAWCCFRRPERTSPFPSKSGSGSTTPQPRPPPTRSWCPARTSTPVIPSRTWRHRGRIHSGTRCGQDGVHQRGVRPRSRRAPER